MAFRRLAYGYIMHTPHKGERSSSYTLLPVLQQGFPLHATTCFDPDLHLPLTTVPRKQSIPTSAVVVCIVANIVLLLIQFLRSLRWRAIWRLKPWQEISWTSWHPWNLWSRLDTWPRWSIIQAICYLFAFILTSIIWQKEPSTSHVAVS